MVPSILTSGLAALLALYAIFRHFTRPTLSALRGPKSPSFVFGNLLELFQRPVGEADFTWQSLYGNVIRFKSILGEDQLLITDPKALQKILNTSMDDYSKLPNLRVVSRMLSGKGIVWADGEDHKRQRKVMLPGFGPNEIKVFLPIFKGCAESVSVKWLETIGNSDGQSVIINVRSILSLAALDAIGQAAFDVQFNTIQHNSHPLAKAYKNYLGDIFGLPPAKQIFMQAASEHIPTWILEKISDHSPNPRLVRARNTKFMVTHVAEELVREKAHALLQGQGNRDIFTLLIKANMDTNAKSRLTNDELLAQMRTILVAGHESTSNSVAWILLELARNYKVQSRLRDEIRKAMAAVQARSDSHFTVADLDAMLYLDAVVKEGLRFHPAAPHIHRIARRDNILPLSKPLLTESGAMIDEVLVPERTHIWISIAAYNRDKSLWGDDAHKFNPERWLNGSMDEKKFPGLGAYANLLTFLSGARGCLGWRFAYENSFRKGILLTENDSVMEIQVFLLELVGKFEFKTTDTTDRVLRQLALVVSPMVDGELDRGIQLPLAVSLALHEGETK